MNEYIISFIIKNVQTDLNFFYINLVNKKDFGFFINLCIMNLHSLKYRRKRGDLIEIKKIYIYGLYDVSNDLYQ